MGTSIESILIGLQRLRQRVLVTRLGVGRQLRAARPESHQYLPHVSGPLGRRLTPVVAELVQDHRGELVGGCS
ncbi:hypothetical protein DDJ31_19840 [Streptomyces griseoviridis]|uniref:Uncharacterized protein n=1 Tax=Streptomyces griseoviridis TaxID=45398 RepID=A0ABX5TW44_STRGD|nr:hypothetical protein DDJ31_19840 [Streptomyces griseoviridis]